MAEVPRGGFGTGRGRLAAALQLAPASIYYLALFGAPLILLVIYSFYTTENFKLVPAFSFENYLEALTDPLHRKFYTRTLRVAGIASLTVIFIAFPLSFIISFVLRARRQVLYFLVLVSLFGGYLVRIYAWRNIFGPAGILNDLLMRVGIVDEPLDLFSPGQFTITVALVNFYIPFAIIPIYSAMQNVSPGLIEAAADLGRSRFRAAIEIVLPLTSRGIAAAFMLTLIATAGEWLTPLMLGGTQDQMVGNEIQYMFGAGYNWPLGAALAIVLVLGVGAILALTGLALRRWLR